MNHHAFLLLLFPLLTLISGFNPSRITVISPPGGIGEVSAVSLGRKGAAVKWFVVSDKANTQITLSEESLKSISAAGGKVDIAGSEASSILDGESVSALRSWCQGGEGVIGTLDGAEEEKDGVGDAVKVAMKEVCQDISKGTRVVVVPGNEVEGEYNLLTYLSKNKKVPENLMEAALGDQVVTLRHGELFGLPESSRDSSPFLDGPRRSPILREEYTLGSVLLSTKLATKTRTSRLSIGEAAALLSLNELDIPRNDLDVSVASLRGPRPSIEEWSKDFKQLLDPSKQSKLLQVDLDISNTARLAEWLATKWAPAIMRTYEIGGIRVGERPTYANCVDDTNVEVVWQSMVNFEPVTVGKMIVNVGEKQITATRVRPTADASIANDALQGEDIIVRSLADAAMQAVEKGLAKKPKTVKPKKAKKEMAPATSAVASGNVVEKDPEVEPTLEKQTLEKPTLETGPRSAGARRSSQKTRGKKKKDKKSKKSGPRSP